MKIRFIAFIFLIIPVLFSNVSAGETPHSKWDNLMDAAYQFTWLPRENLLSFLEEKTFEYGMSLNDYANFLLNHLEKEQSLDVEIDPDNLVAGKSWRTYHRLAVAQFCLYLAGGNPKHLKNADSAISFLSDKKDLAHISFWNNFFSAHKHLAAKNREKFVKSVFDIWQNVILKLESEAILTNTTFSDYLPFMYENMVNLIVVHGVKERRIPDLHALSVIIVTLNDKLTSGKGYKTYVRAIVERMRGIKSDNYNLNFAVAFVEATAAENELNDAKSVKAVEGTFESAREYYDMALACAGTGKGKAAILTQYMGFANYGIRRLIDRDSLVPAEKPIFANLPALGGELTDRAISLYHELGKEKYQQGEWHAQGFDEKANYVRAMHSLWDSTARLLIMQSNYYKPMFKAESIETLAPVEKPLLNYTELFEKYAKTDREIVPNNAFFLAAWTSGELASLYGKASVYSAEIAKNDLALAYGLQSVEIFPLNVAEIVQLAYRTREEGRLNLYLEHVAAVGTRLNASEIAGRAGRGLEKRHGNAAAMISNIIPGVIANGPMLVGYLQNSPNTAQEEIVGKAVLMARIAELGHKDDIAEGALTAISSRDFTGSGKSVDEILEAALPVDLYLAARSVPGINVFYNPSKLVNELYASFDNRMHAFIRDLYYEIPYEAHEYPKLREMATEQPWWGHFK